MAAPWVVRLKRRARKNLLLLLTVVSVFVGLGAGFTARSAEPSQRTIDLIGFPGEILMNMLKMMIIPLIASSLISGLSQLDARQSGRIGVSEVESRGQLSTTYLYLQAYAMLFYATTMTLAVTTGIVLVLIIHPGDPSIKKEAGIEDSGAANVSALEKTLDLMRNMFPGREWQETNCSKRMI